MTTPIILVISNTGTSTCIQLLTRPDINPAIGHVWINADQYFEGVPATDWNFCIGGYQSAQKWLKDRTGRTLSFDDIMHYQRVIKALGMTEEIMKTT